MRAFSANMVRLSATAVGSCGGRGNQSVPPAWKCFWFSSLSFFKNSAILLSNVNRLVTSQTAVHVRGANRV